MTGSPYNPEDLLKFLEQGDDSKGSFSPNYNFWSTQAVIWTLNQDATPIYALKPQGPFASMTYHQIINFLKEQLKQAKTDRDIPWVKKHPMDSLPTMRVSIPGALTGETIRLYSGQVVPVINPNPRAMYSWTINCLIDELLGPCPPIKSEPTEPTESPVSPLAPPPASSEANSYQGKREMLIGLLERIYDQLRNFGVTPQERAINYLGTNVFQIKNIVEKAATGENMLESIDVARSPICRPDSDCWDITVTFFNPSAVLQQARNLYQATIDVSQEIPVTIGRIRHWTIY